MCPYESRRCPLLHRRAGFSCYGTDAPDSSLVSGDGTDAIGDAVAEGRLTEDLWGVERASQFLGVPVGTLYQWRSRRYGPRSYKVGNAVKYDPFDLRAWLLSHVRETEA
jgi:hypothetical protein